jgi:anaerobic magnesium-protoporphyrin IX monomethyl ester cyclase
MKVLVLNPAYGRDFVKSARWFARSRGRVQRHPDYLCQATAVLEQAGHRCVLVDGAARNLDMTATRDIVDDFQPEMVVIQATTPSIYSDISYAKTCKEIVGKHCLTVLVGSHVSAEPRSTLEIAREAVDVVTSREYDFTLLDLAEGTPLSQVKGIGYRADGSVVVNAPREFIKDLDSLPYPAWHHVDPRGYHDFGKLYPFITLVSGRGCESACTFCQLPQVMYGRRYRAMSPARVVDEIEYDLRMFPYLREIMFEDDTLTLRRHRARLADICDEILRRDLDITWSANARADLTDLNLLKLMRRSGCRMLVVGFEFGNQQILNNVHKGIMLQQPLEFAALCRKAGIRVHGCFMIGGPGETCETARQTIDFAKQLPIDTAQFSGLCPYPGTEFYEWARARGYLVPDDWADWVDEDGEQRAIISLPGIGVTEINRLVDQGLREFYLRPAKAAHILANALSPVDLRTKLDGLMGFADYFLHGRQHSHRSEHPQTNCSGCS